ncbi:MAG: S-layer homology domain-containing protein [Clostridia bacterium]|nr:S-layer homology domain-containing protein [Clostridia bacterium]
MMRKVLGILISVLITANIIVLPASAEYQSDKAEKIMCGLGVFAESYEPDKEITRAEFAKVLCDLLHLSDPDRDGRLWRENVMNSNSGKVTITEGIFSDVDPSHPYYAEITLAGQNGLMNGVGEHLFAPEYGITVNEVSKVLLDTMGYSIYAARDGGYPQGYSTLAYSLGMMSGINIQPTSPVTESVLVHMLYNSFEIKLIEISYDPNPVYTKIDDTFMTGVLQLGRVRSYVTDNGFASLHGNTELSPGALRVGGIDVYSRDNGEDLSGYLGHKVELYYTENDGDNYFEYAEIIDESDAVTFNAGDFCSYLNGTVSYYKGSKKINKRLAADAEMIVNNEWKQSFTASDFQFADGTVTLVPDKNGNYGTVIVNSYEFAVVSGKDADKELIYNKITNSSSEKTYDFSGSGVPKNSIFIYDANGDRINFEAVTVDSVLNIIKSKQYMKVVVSGNIAPKFKVNSINKNDNAPSIKDNDVEYPLSGAFMTVTNSDVLANGQTYTLYLNMFGEVIWVEGESANDGVHIAVLTRARYFENEDEANSRCISLYTEKGKLNNYMVDEKFIINGKKMKYDDAMSELNQHKGEAVRYKLDENDKLVEITVASKLNTDSYSNWYQIADPSSDFRFGIQGGDFSNQFYTGSSTLRFTIPNDEAYFGNRDYFSLNSISFIDNKSDYKLSAYVMDKDNVVADAIVIQQDAAVSAGTIKEAEAILIQDIITTINEDGDTILRLSGYEMGLTIGAPRLVEFDIDTECKMIAFGETAPEVDKSKDEYEVGPRTVDELKAGDIIYYETNIKNEITSIRIAFDYSTGKAFDGGRGNDHYDPTTTGTAVNTTWVGRALSSHGNGIRLATGCEPGDVDYLNLANFRKQTSAFVLRRTDSIFIVEGGGNNKINIQNGTINDIRTYNNMGDSCDNVVVLTYWSSGNYATVAYRQ